MMIQRHWFKTFSILFVPSALFVALTTQSSAWAVLQVPSKVRFSVSVDSPAGLQLCAGNLWVYSARNRSLQQLHPQTGTTLATTTLISVGLDGHVLALGCTGKALLVALQKRQGLSDRTFSLARLAVTPAEGAKYKLGRAQAVPAPGKGLIRDIFCRGNSSFCFLIRDRIYKTSDLKKWQPANIALSKDIPFSNTNLEENPFVNWQDDFIIASGQYFRGGFLNKEKESTLYLLDPLRVAITRFPVGAASSPIDQEIKGQKFGRWGVWEGRLMSPKGITHFSSAGKTYFAISDITLKLVFIFTEEGQYIGSTGIDGNAARFNYPLDLTSAPEGNTIYVADFGGSKVTAMDLNPEATPAAPVLDIANAKIEDVLRKNFFRDPEVLKDRSRTRCLSCHDGLEINSLDKFMGQGKHHPVNITMRAVKIDLPLESGNKITCSTCHDAHHGVAEGLEATVKQNPYMLRKAVESLCSTCHPGRADPASNHPGMTPNEACADCHSMHVSQDYLLKEKLPNLCTDCHGADKIPGSHPFSANTVNCVSCHSLHDSVPNLSFATHAKFATTRKGESESTCLMCHSDKQALIGNNYHLGTEPQNTHKWPKDEGMCLDCHDPHAKAKPVRQICAQCHGEVKGNHPASVQAMIGTPAAEGVVLTKGKVDCMTCHDPHGAVPPNESGRSFFRPVTTLLEFCAGCHGDAASEVYRGFHSAGGKK
ncbi:MAG: hypothetical protein A2X97_15130 [Bdellovibrionales bacterium GWA1_52_35]|nr:MAG: hypothetical protein A2X97_15130 [Bdellovibrionales bacterium GWA1_52_35]HCM40470.1 hypothetical protein [Bdellovibrionales bacterium]